jgi:ATP-dependent DNA helicase DinG
MQDWNEIFGAAGPLALSVPGFSVRPEQIGMARRVAHALRGAGHLIVEAGTGIGKTYAYLVPALLSGRRIIISTGTRTLQDQLYARDLPTVAAALGCPVRVALLKGRSNYLCVHRLDLAEQQVTMGMLEPDVARALPLVRRWAQITSRGEIAELAQLNEAAPVWPWVTSTRENCLGTQCPRFERCHVVQARRAAQAADVVIVNHHLLMADLVLKETGFDLLPGVQAVIVDEAHQLADVASLFLGFALSTRQLQALCRDLLVERQAGSVVLERAPLDALVERVADLQQCFAHTAPRSESAAWSDGAIEALDLLSRALAEVAAQLDLPVQHSAVAAALERRAQELRQRIGILLQAPQAEAGVCWAQTGAEHASLHFVPVDVAGQLGALIEAQGGTWICASATLSVAGDFSHFQNRIGLAGAAVVEFGSPFDYRQQALLYLPQQLDEPASPRHTQQVVAAALPVLQASGGRAFLLFTSHRALREAAQLLSEQGGAMLRSPLLVQGDAPREVLLKRFRELGNAVLLGTSSFWEGVDVQGAALSVVIIDKLPFAVPEDPVLKARLSAIERRGGNPFVEEQLPQAALTLKQGVGRLLRAHEDFGVIMLCDRRLQSRGYGRVFLDSLPPMPRTEALADVQQFLAQKFAAAGIDPQRTRRVSR